MEDYISKLQGNIWKLYALDFLRGSILFIPIIIPFMLDTGLTMQEIFIIEGLYMLSAVLLEIPSGYVSDKWGRKNTCILASTTSFIGIFFYAIGGDFLTFFIGAIALGFGTSFYSGTVEALAYDTLLELDDTDSYKRISGNLAFTHFSTEAIMSVLGGFLVVYSLRLPALMTLIPYALACILVPFLTEPRRHKLQEGRHLEVMWNITKESIIHNAPLRSIIILHSIIAFMGISLFWFTQIYQTSVGLPLVYFGITHAVIVLLGAFASKYTYKLESIVDDRLLLTVIAATMFIAYMALGNILSMWALVFFGVVRVAWGTLSPLTSNMINRMTTSDVRATVLSIRSFVFRSMFTVATPFLGYMADVLTINQAILITGCIGGVLLIIALWSISFVWNKIPQ
jgi:MFS family permease